MNVNSFRSIINGDGDNNGVGNDVAPIHLNFDDERVVREQHSN